MCCDSGLSVSLGGSWVNSLQTTFSTVHFTDPVPFGPRNNKVFGISVGACVISAKLLLFTEENLIYLKK